MDDDRTLIGNNVKATLRLPRHASAQVLFGSSQRQNLYYHHQIALHPTPGTVRQPPFSQYHSHRKLHPAITLIPKYKLFRVDDLGENFDRVYDTWPRAVEVLVTVGDIETVVFDGFQVGKAR